MGGRCKEAAAKCVVPQRAWGLGGNPQDTAQRERGSVCVGERVREDKRKEEDTEEKGSAEKLTQRVPEKWSLEKWGRKKGGRSTERDRFTGRRCTNRTSNVCKTNR